MAGRVERGDPLFRRSRKQFSDLTFRRVQFLILDDRGLEPLDARACHDLLEILEERYGRRYAFISRQLSVENWRQVIGGPVYADASLDRLAHNTQRLNLSGDSLHRTRVKPLQKN